MNIKYPVEINIHGQLVDANGVLLAQDVVDGSLADVFTQLIFAEKSDVVNQNFL